MSLEISAGFVRAKAVSRCACHRSPKCRHPRPEKALDNPFLHSDTQSNETGLAARRVIHYLSEQMKFLLSILAVAAIAVSTLAEEQSAEDSAYYQKWIGCKAPPITFDQSDRTNYVETIQKGKQTLLYSFDAGNFVDSANLPRLTAELQSLHQVRTNLTNSFAVIGFTRGVQWTPCFGTTNVPKGLDELSRFPVVNLNNKRGALGEPYEMLMLPGGILIGTNGIICSVFLHPMTTKDFKSISSIPALAGPPHEAPRRGSEK